MTLMDPEWQSIIAGGGLAMSIAGWILVILKNNLQHKMRFKLGVSFIIIGGTSVIFFLKRTASFDKGFSAMILMGLFGMYYFAFSKSNEDRCDSKKYKIFEMKEKRGLLSPEEEKKYLWVITSCHLITVFLVMFCIGVIGSFVRGKMGY